MVLTKQSQYESIRKVSEGDYRFGFTILPRLGKGNITFSPYSIRTALALVYEGARGESAQEISDNAHITSDSDLRLRGYKGLMALLNAKNEGHTLKSANGLWVDSEYQLNLDYRQILQDIYQALASVSDFVNNAEVERGKINKWVSEKTEQKIEELFPVSSIDSYIAVVLANALYFKGFWENKFNPTLTKKQDYRLPTGEVVKVDMMKKGTVERGELPKYLYGKFGGVEAVTIPYRGNELVKLVMLPQGSDTLELEKLFETNPETLEKYRAKMRECSFSRLELPKHEVRSGFSLNAPLQEIGIRRIFDHRTANLSGIGEGPLFIGSGYHQAYFKTDEEGSEGAAATGFAARSLSVSLERPVEFVVDRPFLEMIIHKPTNTLLFLNRIEDPR